MNTLLIRTVLLAGLGLGALPALAQTSRALVPGNVRATGGAVTGSFRLIGSSHGVPSLGTGGACLVADLSRRACHDDEDCRDLRAAYHPDGWAYCLRPKASRGAKRCWIRPGRQSDYCRVSPASPLPLNEDLALPVVDAAPRNDPRHDGKPVRWLIHGCLNRFDPATGRDHPGCRWSDPARMKTWNGKATTVHP